jgi:hypothetical protein
MLHQEETELDVSKSNNRTLILIASFAFTVFYALDGTTSLLKDKWIKLDCILCFIASSMKVIAVS